MGGDLVLGEADLLLCCTTARYLTDSFAVKFWFRETFVIRDRDAFDAVVNDAAALARYFGEGAVLKLTPSQLIKTIPKENNRNISSKQRIATFSRVCLHLFRTNN